MEIIVGAGVCVCSQVGRKAVEKVAAEKDVALQESLATNARLLKELAAMKQVRSRSVRNHLALVRRPVASCDDGT